MIISKRQLKDRAKKSQIVNNLETMKSSLQTFFTSK